MRNLFAANLPPKPIHEMSDWLDAPEGKDWFLNPIVGWDANGEPIRSPIDGSLITAGTIDASAIGTVCLRCNKNGADCICDPLED